MEKYVMMVDHKSYPSKERNTQIVECGSKTMLCQPFGKGPSTSPSSSDSKSSPHADVVFSFHFTNDCIKAFLRSSVCLSGGQNNTGKLRWTPFRAATGVWRHQVLEASSISHDPEALEVLEARGKAGCMSPLPFQCRFSTVHPKNIMEIPSKLGKTTGFADPRCA